MENHLPPAYSDINISPCTYMYVAVMENNQIHVYMKKDYIEMFSEIKIMSYVGEVKKEQDMVDIEYTEYISRVQLRINTQEYKILSINLDVCEIQIFLETYFKIKVILGSFVPTEIRQHQLNSDHTVDDLIPLAYLQPLHKSLKRLSINNISKIHTKLHPTCIVCYHDKEIIWECFNRNIVVNKNLNGQRLDSKLIIHVFLLDMII